MTRRVHLVVFAVLLALCIGPVSGASAGVASGSVSGQVSDSAGVPQIGAQVQLLRPDLTVISSVYTDSHGRYAISTILPGRYAVKAMGAWFLPSLRENVRVHANAVASGRAAQRQLPAGRLGLDAAHGRQPSPAALAGGRSVGGSGRWLRLASAPEGSPGGHWPGRGPQRKRRG